MKKIDPLLKTLLSTPVAPFREHQVRNFLSDLFSQWLIPHFTDEVGNLIVGVSSKEEFEKELTLKTTKPLNFFIAHMDHPGFLVTKALSATRFEFEWMGGGPTGSLKGAPLFLSNLNGDWREAKILSYKLSKKKTYVTKGILECPKASELKDNFGPKTWFGGYHFKSWAELKNDTIYTKSADDLLGVYAIVKAFLTGGSKSSQAKNIALLSIAEEVGWVGTLWHFENTKAWHKVSRPHVAINLEASKELPRAEMGKGAVVRLGDRMGIFHASYSESLLNLARKTLKKKFQNRVMDGGVCEAAVTQAWGIPTVAACVPLGNYHNATSDNKVGPEYINAKDAASLCKLVAAIMNEGLNAKAPNLFAHKKTKMLKELKLNEKHLKKSLF